MLARSWCEETLVLRFERNDDDTQRRILPRQRRHANRTAVIRTHRRYTHILTNHTPVNHSNLAPPLTFSLASITTLALTVEIVERLLRWGVKDDGNNSDIETPSTAEARDDESVSSPTPRPNIPIAAPPRDCVVYEQLYESATHVHTQHGTQLFDEVEDSKVERDGSDESRDNDDSESECGVANTTTGSARCAVSITALAAKHSFKCPSSIHAWKAREGGVRAAYAVKKSSKRTVGGQGRNVILAHDKESVQWVKDMRRDDFPLNLHRLVKRLIACFGFSFHRPTRSVLSYEQLISEQEAFVSPVGAAVAATHSSPGICKTDETGVYYDDSPMHIIAERGCRKSSKVKGKEQSCRESVLLVVSAASEKLPPLIGIQATPGGSVEKGPSALPDRARYADQTNGWMDGDVRQCHFIGGLWSDYVNSDFREPMALYVDNFKSYTDLHQLLKPSPVLALSSSLSRPTPQSCCSRSTWGLWGRSSSGFGRHRYQSSCRSCEKGLTFLSEIDFLHLHGRQRTQSGKQSLEAWS
ncbi:hypothetical protein PybrP1_013074 [[Pythium] brassicae (nom. inval.)]|nr:hypothetical protein PybrP1_013074 [[Pythium] brassicae (nom. inval.)]